MIWIRRKVDNLYYNMKWLESHGILAILCNFVSLKTEREELKIGQIKWMEDRPIKSVSRNSEAKCNKVSTFSGF